MSDDTEAPRSITEEVWKLVNASLRGSAKALEELGSLYRELREELGRYHTATLTAQLGTGVVFHHSGDIKSALRTYVQIRQKLNAAYHWSHPLFVELYEAMADLYSEQDLFLEAQALIEMALEISELAYGIAAPSTASLHLKLGSAVQAQNEFDKAQHHYGQALSLYKELGSPEHVHASLSLGGLFHAHARFEQAAAVLEEAVGTKEFLTLDPARIVETLEVLRESLHNCDHVNKAALYELQRIQIVFETQDLTPIQKVNLYHRFLTLFELIEIPDVRDTACRDFLDLTEQACGKDSFAWAEAQQLLGECYCLSKKFEDARTHLQIALTHFDANPDQVTTQRAELLKTLGTIELFNQQPLEAHKYLAQAIEEFEERGVTDSIAYVQTLQASALVQKSQGNKRGAVQFLEKIIKITSGNEELVFFGEQARNELEKLDPNSKRSDKKQGEEAVEDAADKMNRVGALFNQALQCRDKQEFSRALRLFEEILDIMETTQGETHPDLGPILEQIGMTHQKLGNADLAKTFSERAKGLSS